MNTNIKSNLPESVIDEIVDRCFDGQPKENIVAGLTGKDGVDQEELLRTIDNCFVLKAEWESGIESGVRAGVSSAIDRAFANLDKQRKERKQKAGRFFLVTSTIISCVAASLFILVQSLGLFGILSSSNDESTAAAFIGWSIILIVFTLPSCALSIWLLRKIKKPKQKTEQPTNSFSPANQAA